MKRILKNIGASLLGVSILVAIIWAAFDALVFVGNAMAKKPPAQTDVAMLCEPYGGLADKNIYRNETDTQYKNSVHISVDCKDGSRVSRTVEIRK